VSDDTATEERPGPLSGLRVVDLSSTLTGAHTTQFLADFGAEVTMVEGPGGHPLRSQPAWPFWARGKRSILLDLRDPADLATARRLASGADVVVQTWRPGVAERLGLGYDDLSAGNPRLILSAVTGFGRTGPLRHLKGYEQVVMAKVGGLDAWGGITPRPGPAYTSAPFAAFSASQVALHGILAALVERQHSGRGQQVDTSLVQSLAAHDTWNWLIQMLVARYSEAFSAAAPADADAMVPNSPLFFRLMAGLSRDGRWMQLSQTTDKLWNAFLGLAGKGDLVAAGIDPAKDEDPQTRVAFWAELLTLLRSRTYDEWLVGFDQEPDVWAETFRSGTELLDHPQIVFDGNVVTPDVDGLGPVRQPGPLVDMAVTPGSATGAVPALDQHGAAIRAALEQASTGTPAAPGGRAPTSAPPGEPPLAGITVVELGTFFAGPFGATLLADLGARVIKLEALEGDPIRNIMPFPEVGGVKVLQGKETVAVDIASPEGREIAYALIGQADVVLQCFRAGVAERLGFDAPTLLARHPGLVYLNAPGYGTGGPCGHRPAFAPTIGAGSGLAMRNVGPSMPEDPTALELDDVKRAALRLSAATMGYAHADGFSALGVGTALLLGLVAKRLGGPGQEMTTTMLSTMAHALSEDMVEYEGRVPMPAADPELHGPNALYRLYRSAGDGWVFLAAPQDREWPGLLEALAPWVDLAADGRFADPASRLANDAEQVEVLAEVFARHPAAEWEAELVPADVACVEVARGPVENNVTGLTGLGRDHGFLVDTEHPLLGEHVRLAPLNQFSRSGGVAGPAALVGAHTEAVLAELGYDAEQVADLRARGVVGGSR
jgi:crotonobetainyl-CoA:carnitine CoA-transferase CaiB-like acyl-CoA transferase